MFSCKSCKEKDSHIESLKAQIAFLQTMLNPPHREDFIGYEANKILDGGAMPVVELTGELSADQIKAQREIELEATRIITGTY